jgi:hypothetical protein
LKLIVQFLYSVVSFWLCHTYFHDESSK